MMMELRRNLKTIVVISLCCAPAALVNYRHAAETGDGGVFFSIVAVSFVLAAAVSGIQFERSRGLNRIIAAGLLIGFTTANFANAISVNGSHRAGERDSAAHTRMKFKSLADDAETMQQTISELEARIGPATVSSLTAEIEAAKLTGIYRRTRSCTPAEVTIDESRRHCGELATKEALLKDAKRLEGLRGDLAGIRQQLRSTAAPESVDRSAAAITATLGLLGIETGERFVGTLLDLLRAALVEMLAAFMPMILLAARPEKATGRPKPVAVPDVSETPRARPACSVRAFVETLEPSGDFRPASELYGAYERFCRAHELGNPKTPRALGLGLRNAGFEKKLVGGKSHWRARVATTAPRLVAAE